MAKFIGTGKDPRFPRGHDFDVPDGPEAEHIEEAGLGEPVEPGTEAYAIHRGYDTIAADPGEEGYPVEQSQYGGVSRVASRVETTSGKGKRAKSPEAAVEAARADAEGASGAEGSEGEPAGAKAAEKSGADKEGAKAKTGERAEK